ncbi:MAG: subclass B3 metallo-beta-lactamase [Opitutaceae bacterium]
MTASRVWLITLCCLANSLAPAQQPPPTVQGVKNMFDPWRAPVPPRHLISNIYYVGAIGVSSYLITSPEGHILLDTGFEDTVPIIQKGVEQLGFKLTDIKIILSSHAHIDHVAGHAALKKLSGARIYASAEDAKTLESGGLDDFIPFPRETILYPPAKVDRIVRDEERITLGATTLTAHLTPGHTRGATTWTMEVTDQGQTYRVVFFSSASINAGTRLLSTPGYPRIVEDFTSTFAKLKAIPCDIFLAPHGGQFAMADKFARLETNPAVNPFIDRTGFQTVVEQAERAFTRQLAAEKAAAAARGTGTPATP